MINIFCVKDRSGNPFLLRSHGVRRSKKDCSAEPDRRKRPNEYLNRIHKKNPLPIEWQGISQFILRKKTTLLL